MFAGIARHFHAIEVILLIILLVSAFKMFGCAGRNAEIMTIMNFLRGEESAD